MITNIEHQDSQLQIEIDPVLPNQIVIDLVSSNQFVIDSVQSDQIVIENKNQTDVAQI